MVNFDWFDSTEVTFLTAVLVVNTLDILKWKPINRVNIKQCGQAVKTLNHRMIQSFLLVFGVLIARHNGGWTVLDMSYLEKKPPGMTNLLLVLIIFLTDNV